MIPPMSARIVLVEDDGPTRSHLAQAVEAHADLVLEGVAATFAEGRQLLDQHRPDVLLTDLGLPDGSGIDLIRALRSTARCGCARRSGSSASTRSRAAAGASAARASASAE